MFWLIITVASGCAIIGAIIGGIVLMALSRVPSDAIREHNGGGRVVRV